MLPLPDFVGKQRFTDSTDTREQQSAIKSLARRSVGESLGVQRRAEKGELVSNQRVELDPTKRSDPTANGDVSPMTGSQEVGKVGMGLLEARALWSSASESWST